jgi:hypothetical protein
MVSAGGGGEGGVHGDKSTNRSNYRGHFRNVLINYAKPYRIPPRKKCLQMVQITRMTVVTEMSSDHA